MASQQLSYVSRLSVLALVISLPASIHRADKRDVGEEIERGVTSEAAPLYLSLADVGHLLFLRYFEFFVSQSTCVDDAICLLFQRKEWRTTMDWR